MEDSIGDRFLERQPQIRLNLIDGYISSYYYFLNLAERLENKRQANKLASVLCDLESACMREREEKNNRAMGAEENRRRKYEENQVRENGDRLRGIEIC